MAVVVEKTNSEQRRRFVTGIIISQKEVSYGDSTQATGSPIAAKIFGFPWTQSVTVGTHFVEVEKQDWVEWDVLEEPLQGLIEEHFAGRAEGIEENPEAPTNQSQNLSSPQAEKILALIEHNINPALASHGGFVTLHSVEDNKVFLEMGGGCQGCAMSYQTMKEGIEGAIKEVVPEITEVVDVTNHGAGDNPYFT